MLVHTLKPGGVSGALVKGVGVLKGLREAGEGVSRRQQVSVRHQGDSSVLSSDRASLVSSELHSRHVFM